MITIQLLSVSLWTAGCYAVPQFSIAFPGFPRSPVPGPPCVTPSKLDEDVDVSAPPTNFLCGVRSFRTRIPSGLQLARFKRKTLEVKKGRPSDTPTAVGGFEPPPTSWPWVVLLGWRGKGGKISWLCDGSLVNTDWVLTAGHCVTKRGAPHVVRLGEHNYTDPADTEHLDLGVDQVVLHPSFTPPVAYHDMALIKVAQSVPQWRLRKNIRPICMPWGAEIDRKLVSRPLYLTGWGATSFGGALSPIPQEVHLTAFDSSACVEGYSKLRGYQKTFPSGITSDNLMCAGDKKKGADACEGDSGAPLVLRSDGRYVLAGVVSKGYGCGHPDFPGLYTPLYNAKHLAWVKQVAFSRCGQEISGLQPRPELLAALRGIKHSSPSKSGLNKSLKQPHSIHI